MLLLTLMIRNLLYVIFVEQNNFADWGKKPNVGLSVEHSDLYAHHITSWKIQRISSLTSGPNEPSDLLITSFVTAEHITSQPAQSWKIDEQITQPSESSFMDNSPPRARQQHEPRLITLCCLSKPLLPAFIPHLLLHFGKTLVHQPLLNL